MLASASSIRMAVFVSAAILAYQPIESHAAVITQKWISKDESEATITLSGNESIRLPGEGGGEVVITCTGAVSCTVTIADFKDKNGNITYDTDLSGLQTATGDINSGFGRFEITTTGDLNGLFSSSIAFGELISSTGFDALIGTPGDQLPQGGMVSFSTKWFSDTPIGIDPLTGDNIILGSFFLDSIDPISAFDFIVTDPFSPRWEASFTVGQQYNFSTGLEITGTVSKEMRLPEPSSLLLFGLGFALLTLTISRRKRHNSTYSL